MKQVLLILVTLWSGNSFVNMPSGDFKELWAKVESFEKQNLPQSAFSIVQEIYKKAKVEKAEDQLVKAVIYKIKLSSQFEDRDPAEFITELEEEYNSVNSKSLRLIFNSMLGELYHQYGMRNMGRFQDRTNNIDEQKDQNLSLWSLPKIQTKAFEYYMSSLQEIPKIDIDDFEVITQNATDNRFTVKVSSLNQFLMLRAITHFSNSQSLVALPIGNYDLDNSDYFKSDEVFKTIKIEEGNDIDFKLEAIKLFQDIALSSSFTEDQKLKMQISRIEYMRTHSNIYNKDKFYIEALKEIAESNTDIPSGQLACVKLIEYNLRKGEMGRNANVLSEDKVDYFGEVFRWIQKSKKSYPKGTYSYEIDQQRNRLYELSLQIKTERVVVPDEKFLAQVSYRNTKKAYLKLVKLSNKTNEKYRALRKQEDKLEFLLSSDLFAEWNIALPKSDDFNFHNIEIPIEGLTEGTYYLLASNNASFSFNENDMDLINEFQVSNLSFIHQNRSGNLEGYVLSRDEGQKVSNATVEIYTSKYEPKTRKSIWERVKVLQTDNDGYFKYSDQQGNFSIKVIKASDVLDLRNSHYNYKNQDRDDFNVVKVFTDRAIYRPGQIIYFKGLGLNIKHKSRMPSILKNKSIDVTFLDVNWQEVSKQTLTTNEFGTFSGSFIAPSSGLTGRHTIKVDLKNGNGQKTIQIEEYKRPKFYLEFDKLVGSPVLGDSISMKGNLIAFSGVKMDEVKINYYVVKKQNYYPYYRYRSSYAPSNRAEEIIARGQLLSNEEGSFNIEFQTEKSFGNHQSYRYEIKVDATDLTGMSTNGSKVIVLSQVPFSLKTNLPNNVFSSEWDPVTFNVTNIEGQNVKANISIKTLKLIAPEYAKKNKYWQAPDINFIAEKEFYNYFPNDEYGDNSNPSTWEIDKVIFEKTMTSDSTANFDFSDLKRGAYKFEIKVKDDLGNIKEYTRYVNVTSKKGTAIPTDYIWHSSIRKKYQPGEKLEININLPYKKFNLYYRIGRSNEIIQKGWISNRKKSIDYVISEADRGNLEVELLYVKHNRIHSKRFPITIPWDNKNLSLTIDKFRNRIEPGSDQSWTIKVQDNNGENVSAEVLASMYDKSLDQFVVNNWKEAFYPTAHSGLAYQGVGFHATNAIQLKRYNRISYQTHVSGFSPLLNWFGFYLPYRGNSGQGGGIMKDRMVMKSAGAPQAMESRAAETTSYDMNNADTSIKEESVEANGGVLNSGGTVGDKDSESFAIRENLNETVFFYPELNTDSNGESVMTFKMNEALTKWKLMLMAHTQDLEYTFKTYDLETYKDLIIEPNLPRFLRQGDEILLNAKVTNLGSSNLNAQAKMSLLDHSTKKDVTASFLGNNSSEVSINLEVGESKIVEWRIKVPDTFTDLLDVKMIVHSDDISDGELNQVPVLSNRMLVTESMVMHVGALENEVFKFESMRKMDSSETLDNYKYKIEFYSNPSWLVLKSLPSMIDEESLVTTQLFDAYYATNLGYDLVSKDQSIKDMIQLWITKDEKGALSKNESLKFSKLNETPWIREAMLENENIRQLAGFLNDNNVQQKLAGYSKKIEQRMLSNGGFTWTPEGRDNWYVTQYILEGIVRLKSMGIKADIFNKSLITKAVNYIDYSLMELYKNEKKKSLYLSPLIIQYLYVRPQFNEVAINDELRKVITKYQEIAEKEWTKRGSFQQGMIAYGFFLDEKNELAQAIIKSLKERLVKDKKLGFYWNDQAGYYWYNLNVEKQAFMIDLFNLMGEDQSLVDGLKLWLLKTKQVTSWKTTKETASAVYAFMKDGKSWIESKDYVTIDLPAMKSEVSFDNSNISGGYATKEWTSKEVTVGLGELEVSNPNNHVAWGAAYWQYFEDLAKVEAFEGTPLKLKKEIFKVEQTDEGDALSIVSDKNGLQPGDKVRIKIQLTVDRPMEFIQMKDMRGSGLEPLNVLSQNKWQDGLSYYESTKDVATYFYFDFLPKGSFSFEYDVYVVHEGEYSNGNCSIQSFYAPEFSSHSSGIKINVRK